MASGTATSWWEVANHGWWDPGGYWYTGAPVPWIAQFAVALPPGEAISALVLFVDDGDLGHGMQHQLLQNDDTLIAQSGYTGLHGTNQYGGAASIGMHEVASWSADSPASYLYSGAVRYRCAPAASGNQQHYLFGARVWVGWTSVPVPAMAMLL